MLHLTHRPRRLRSTDKVRQLVQETRLDVRQLIYPLFVSEKVSARSAISSMPGVDQLSLTSLKDECQSSPNSAFPPFCYSAFQNTKMRAHLRPALRTESCNRQFGQSKQSTPELIVITDVCLCEYTSHGHCGLVTKEGNHYHVLNDASVELLAKTAVSHAAAGADIVAPSDMMDGRVGVIRAALDSHGYLNVALMSYAAKYCSAFYGPFRDAAESTPRFGDRRTYQMDPANGLEALREVALDVEEGAELLIIKPGLSYLDILWRVKERFELPTAVYNVSGEYAMVKAAAKMGWIDEKRAVMEMMLGFRRAGADMIITYWAKDLAVWLT